MRIKYSLAIVLFVLFASVLDLTSALAEDPSADMGPPKGDVFLHDSRARDPARATNGANWEQESTCPDPLAYVPIIAVIAIVAFLLYLARCEKKHNRS